MASTPTIRAIETRYAGCRFRSRLEARWAVFFDHLGIEWEYEPQGFIVNGQPYLPDFLLTSCATWIEVKGDAARLDVTLLRSAAAILPRPAPQGGELGPALMLLGTIPRPLLNAYWGDFGWTAFDDSGDWYPYGFANYSKNGRPWALSNFESESREWLVPVVDHLERGCPAAYAAARSARFEHGAIA